MSRKNAVSHLVTLIWQQFRGTPYQEIESELVNQGWSQAAVREAIRVYRSTRQFT